MRIAATAPRHDRTEPAGARELARTSLWLATFIPVAGSWDRSAQATYLSPASLSIPIAMGVALAIVRRRPRALPAVPVAVAIVLTAQLGWSYGLGFTFMACTWAALTAAAGRMVELPRLDPTAAVPAAAVGAAAQVAILYDELWVALALTAIAATVAGLTVVVPPLRRIAESVGAWTLRVGRPVARPPWAIWLRCCTWLARTGPRWWHGELAPAGPWMDRAAPARGGRAEDTPVDGAAEDDDDPARSTARPWFPLAVWATATTLVSLAVQGPPGEQLYGRWMRWDAWQYIRIAELGYQYEPGRYFWPSGEQTQVAWFPGFGLAIRGVRLGLGLDSYAAAAYALTLASGLAAVLLLWTWTGDRGLSLATRRTTVVLFAFFPWCFMLYGAGWSDAFVTALTFGCFVAVGRGRHVLGGLLAAVAMLARPNAIALPLAAGLAVVGPWAVARWRARHHGDPQPSFGRLLADRRWPLALLPLVALGGFVAWCGWAYDEPLLYWNARREVFPPIDLSRLMGLIKATFPSDMLQRAETDPLGALNRTAGALVALLTLWSLPVLWRRFGGLATTFVGLSIAIVWFGATDFVAAGRYLMIAFPAFAAWAGWLERRRVATVAVVVAFAAGQLYLTYQYTSIVDLGW